MTQNDGITHFGVLDFCYNIIKKLINAKQL